MTESVATRIFVYQYPSLNDRALKVTSADTKVVEPERSCS